MPLNTQVINVAPVAPRIGDGVSSSFDASSVLAAQLLVDCTVIDSKTQGLFLFFESSPDDVEWYVAQQFQTVIVPGRYAFSLDQIGKFVRFRYMVQPAGSSITFGAKATAKVQT